MSSKPWEVQLILASMSLDGDYNNKYGLTDIEKFAAQGNQEALSYIGFLYVQGSHLNKDIRKAMKFFKDAGEESRTALHYLGLFKLKTSESEIDNREGMQLLTKAAMLSNEESAAILGSLYMGGRFVEKDPIEAIAWLIVAKRRGHKKAKEIYQSFLDEGVRADGEEFSKATLRADNLDKEIQKNKFNWYISEFNL